MFVFISSSSIQHCLRLCQLRLRQISPSSLMLCLRPCWLRLRHFFPSSLMLAPHSPHSPRSAFQHSHRPCGRTSRRTEADPPYREITADRGPSSPCFARTSRSALPRSIRARRYLYRILAIPCTNSATRWISASVMAVPEGRHKPWANSASLGAAAAHRAVLENQKSLRMSQVFQNRIDCRLMNVDF